MTPPNLLPIRERVAIELFVAYRSGGGWAGSRALAREAWPRTTPATMDDWRRRADQLIEALAAVDVTLVHDVEASHG